MQKGNPIDFSRVNKLSHDLAERIQAKRSKLIEVLTRYETYKTAQDEIERTLDLLTSLEENRMYFKKAVGPVAVFMPSNQPLYAFACFAIVPGFMSERVCVKAPETMAGFYEDMLNILHSNDIVPSVEYMRLPRKKCVDMFTATKIDPSTNKQQPVFEAVIFTGTTENADKLRRSFHKSTLFIANGSGHNPVVVTESAELDRAIEGIMSVRTYNQGQDCAAPNSILVHTDIYDQLMKKLRDSVAKLCIGEYASPHTDIGPISRPETIATVQEFLAKNSKYIDHTTDGVIRTRTAVIEPVIITKPLQDGGNFEELFAPVFIIQRYNSDEDLSIYFEDERYAKNAMYITIYGKSDYVEQFIRHKGKKLHDTSTVLTNIDLHQPGVERGVQAYGGYGRGASCVSKEGIIVSRPTLPQKELYDYLAEGEKLVANASPRKKRSKSNRPQEIEASHRAHWGIKLANKVSEKFPSRDEYVCAAGISPSGRVHFGNFRDLFTSEVVAESLRAQGKKARLILYWDDFDRFGKVPDYLDPAFKQYIGLPYSKVPSPNGAHTSYAEMFEKEFEDSIGELGIEPEIVYQTAAYESGMYDDFMIECLQNRKAIADILLSFMSPQAKLAKSIKDEEYREAYYPVVLYSRFTGKDNTRIIAYDGESTLTYKCFDSGKTDSIDITKDHIVKLSWKIDWAMRWGKSHTAFEPAGSDHASPGGSFDVSSKIAREIFTVEPPVLQEYKFVGLQGMNSKMSSLHASISVGDVLQIYTPEMLKWLYAHKAPNQSFELSFGKDVFRQYDEFDAVMADMHAQKANNVVLEALRLSGIRQSSNGKPPISFRQLLGLGQIVQWDKAKIENIFKMQEVEFDNDSLSARLPRIRHWLEEYNDIEALVVRDRINTSYRTKMSNSEIAQIQRLHAYLKDPATFGASLENIEDTLYDIPREPHQSEEEVKKQQKRFFTNVYNLLIGSSRGPRLSTFIWAMDRKRILKLLDIKEMG